MTPADGNSHLANRKISDILKTIKEITITIRDKIRVMKDELHVTKIRVETTKTQIIAITLIDQINHNHNRYKINKANDINL